MAQEAFPQQHQHGTSQTSPPSFTRAKAQWFYARDGDWVAFPPSDTSALESKWVELGGDDPEEFWMTRRRDAESENEDEDAGKQTEPRDSQAPQSQSDTKPAEAPATVKVGSSGSVAADKDADAESKGWAATVQNLIWSRGNSQEWEGVASQPPEEKSKGSEATEKQDEEDEAEEGPTLVEEILDPDEPEENRRFKVAVLEDRLFDVDLETMRMYPAFFKGVLLPVVRSTWFYWSELRDEYSPIDWSGKFGRALEQAWKDTDAIALGNDQAPAGKAQSKEKLQAEGSKPKKESSKKEGTKLVEIPVEGAAGKGQVKFSSACEASVFSEDFRGRMVSLVGGSTVIRGFDEIERRVKAAKTSGNFFDMPDISLPWGSDEDEVNEAATASRKAGAARPGSKDAPAGGGGYGSSQKKGGSSQGEGSEAAEEDSQGFAARLWPSNGGWWRGLKSLGLGGTEEAKRSQKQRNTEEAAKPDGEVREESKKSRAPGDDSAETEVADEDEAGSEADDADAGPEQDEDEDLDDRKDDPVHLILVIHGIGQGLRDTFESLDFTYDVQKIRNLSRERCQDPAIRKLSRGRRVQYLPICWRRNLSFDYFPEENDNHFRLRDVTNDATIPFVRNVVSKVILDVPYYLSQVHKPKMVKAVKEELNRVFRLFIRRNPDFLEKGGRVSLIGHSLGSCLTADILSNQDTSVPPIEKLSAAEAQALSSERLLFNVQDVFLVGSPLGLFLLLGGGQLKARRTDYNAHVGDDASSEEPGHFGCMAIHGNLYNVYHSSDPVAYRLNGAVDARYARLLRPIPLPGAVNAILDALQQPRLSISQLFDARHPFRGAKDVSGGSAPASGPFIGQRPDEARYAETSDAARAAGSKSKSRGTALAAKTEVSVNNAGESASAAVAVATGKDNVGQKDGRDQKGQGSEEEGSSSEDEDGEEEGADADAHGEGGSSAVGPDALSPPRSGLASPVRMEAGDRAKRSLPHRVLEVELAERARQEDSGDGDGKAQEGSQGPSRTNDPQRNAPAPAPTSPSPDPLSHFGLSLDSLSKAERRFRALNKHGCVDFYFSSSSPMPSPSPGAGPVPDGNGKDSSSAGSTPTEAAGLGGMLSNAANTFGEYISMLSAHNGYWTSPSFVDLVLTQVMQAEDQVPLPGRRAQTQAEGEKDEGEDGEKGKEGDRKGAGREVTMVPSVGKAV